MERSDSIKEKGREEVKGREDKRDIRGGRGEGGRGHIKPERAAEICKCGAGRLRGGSNSQGNGVGVENVREQRDRDGKREGRINSRLATLACAASLPPPTRIKSLPRITRRASHETF